MRVASPVVIAASILLVAAGCSSLDVTQRAAVDAARTVRENAARPFDDPAEAEEFERGKRLSAVPDVDPIALYATARERLAALDVYSTRLDGPLRNREIARTSDAAWRELGPGNFGGRVRTLVIHPSESMTMIAGGVSGGVWKTTNGGASWRPTSDELTNLAINSLVMHPADPTTLLAGTGEGYFREEVRGTALPLRGGGIFITHDTGDSWSLLPSTATSDFYWVNDLVYGTRAPHAIYAATRSGVWRSADGGESWSRILDPGVNGGCLDLAIMPSSAGDTLFASCGTLGPARVYRSLQPETSIAAWETVLSEPDMGRTTLAVAPSNPDVIYALSARNDTKTPSRNQSLYAVFRSKAAGAAGSWEGMVRPSNPTESVAATILTNPIAGLIDKCDPQEKPQFTNMGWYCNVIAVDPIDENRVWAAGVDLFRSDDGGKTWGFASYWWPKDSEPAFVHADQHHIVFHPQYDGVTNRTMFVTNDGGIARTDDATAPVAKNLGGVCNPKASQLHFTSLSNDFGVTQFYHGAAVGNARTYVAGAQDNGTLLGSDDAGKNGWHRINGGDGGYVAVDPTDPNTIYVSSQVGNIRKSIDGGHTYVNTTIPDDPKFLFIAPFVLDIAKPSRLWIGGERLWRTEDAAVTWTAASATLDGRVSAIAVKSWDSDLVVAGTSSGMIYRSTVATTTTASTLWSGVQPRSGFVSSLAFDPYDPTTVYATYAGFGGAHVWKSTDNGTTWNAIDGSGAGALPDIPVHAIVVDPTRVGRLFIGTDLGVLVSTDGGASWMQEFTGFPNVVTEWLAYGKDGNGTSLLAFTHGRGVWKVDLETKRKRGVRR